MFGHICCLVTNMVGLNSCLLTQAAFSLHSPSAYAGRRLVTQAAVVTQPPSGYTGCRLVTQAVWLHGPSGYTGHRLVTQAAVGLHSRCLVTQVAFRYISRLVTQAVWLHGPPSGYTGRRLVTQAVADNTEAVWLRKPFGYQSR